MQIIYKYEIKIQESQLVELPGSHKVLSFGAQDNKLYIWCVVDTLTPVTQKIFYLFATGQDLSKFKVQQKLQFIDKAELYEGKLIYHLFQEE